MTHIFDVLFQLSHQMLYAGLVKRAKSYFENCNNNPEEAHVHGDYIFLHAKPWIPGGKISIFTAVIH